MFHPLRFLTPLLLFPLLCAADALPLLSLEDLAAQSESIVEGRVVRAWSGMDPEGRFIWTHYQLQVNATWKGAAAATVTISEPGGTLGGRTLYVQGSTHYAMGEEVAVFLYRTPIGYLRTTNYGQGKFTLTGGIVHGNEAIHLAGAVVSPTAYPSTSGTRVETVNGMSRAAFEARVKRIGRRQ